MTSQIFSKNDGYMAEILRSQMWRISLAASYFLGEVIPIFYLSFQDTDLK